MLIYIIISVRRGNWGQFHYLNSQYFHYRNKNNKTFILH